MTARHHAAATVRRSIDDDELPEGVDASEVEEARMLEAALLGVPYRGRVPDFSTRFASWDPFSLNASAYQSA